MKPWPAQLSHEKYGDCIFVVNGTLLIYNVTQMNLVMAIFFGMSTLYGGVLIYGLKRKWHWVTDPPEWLFAFYFPATVKILCGPKAVSAAAYITAWGHFVIGVVCLIPPLVDLILSWL